MKSTKSNPKFLPNTVYIIIKQYLDITQSVSVYFHVFDSTCLLKVKLIATLACQNNLLHGKHLLLYCVRNVQSLQSYSSRADDKSVTIPAKIATLIVCNIYC